MVWGMIYDLSLKASLSISAKSALMSTPLAGWRFQHRIRCWCWYKWRQAVKHNTGEHGIPTAGHGAPWQICTAPWNCVRTTGLRMLRQGFISQELSRVKRGFDGGLGEWRCGEGGATISKWRIFCRCSFPIHAMWDIIGTFIQNNHPDSRSTMQDIW